MFTCAFDTTFGATFCTTSRLCSYSGGASSFLW